MAWVRIDDQAPRHHKMLKAGPAACWLWVCGIAHCQSQLTNGFISDHVLTMIGVKGRPRCVRLATILVTAGLFERVENGYLVHDYLASNATREEALAKQANRSEQRRLAGVASGERRLTERRLVEEARTAPLPERSTSPLNEPVARSLNPIPSHPILKEPEREKSASLPPPADPFVNPQTTERAGRFLERYELLYVKHRKGARYARKPMRDYAAAVTLCDTWADDGRLDKLATIFLTTDHKFAEEGSRTVPQFLALASWCDGKLAEHEAKPRPA